MVVTIHSQRLLVYSRNRSSSRRRRRRRRSKNCRRVLVVRVGGGESDTNNDVNNNNNAAVESVGVSEEIHEETAASARLLSLSPSNTKNVAPSPPPPPPPPRELSETLQPQVKAVKTNVSRQSPRATPSRDATVPPTHFHAAQPPKSATILTPELNGFLSTASHGHGGVSSIDILEKELQQLEASIYQQNDGKPFNIDAPKQVALVLFGPDGQGQSTRKDVLDAMAGAGHRMADLVLQYRTVKNRIRKMRSRQESVEKGVAVHSASTVARPDAAAVAAATKATTSNDDGDDVDPAEDASDAADAHDVQMRVEMSDPLILMDVSAFIFRAYYSMPPIHRGDGMPTNAVMGFCNTLNLMFLNQMLEGEQPRLVLCFDAAGKTFRDDLYSEYKSNRKEAPMDLKPQFNLVREAAKAYGICQIEATNYEADDVIATLATMAVKEGMDTNILSGDKDLMQLVTDLGATPSIQLIDPIKKTRSAYPQVLEKWGVTPDKLGDVLGLAGDSSDNIPGVRGIGPKIAAKLINEFGSLDNLLDNIDDVKQKGIRAKLHEHKDNARLSRELVELDRKVPMDHMTGFPDGITDVGELRVEPIDVDRMLTFYDQMGFRQLKRTLEGKLKGRKLKRPPSSRRPKAVVPKPEDFADVPF